MAKRPPGLAIICTPQELEARESYTVTDGTFEKSGVAIGPDCVVGLPGISPEGGPRLAIDQFELGDVLGKGASCICRKALHRPTGHTMAIKIINMADSSKRDQLVKELQTLISPSKVPQFVNMFDAFFHEGHVYIVLEYMDLGSIDNIAKKCSARVPEAYLSYLLREVVIGLYWLMERDQIHRDIKPGNILFSSNGDVKLGDFGITKTLQDCGTLKEASTYIGTSLYMSPERLQGKKYNFNSDIWSVGIMAIELATGRYPYDTTGGLYALMSRVIESPPPVPGPADGFSPMFCDFVFQTLQLDPRSRPMAAALKEHPFLNQPCSQDRAGFIAWLHSI